MLRMSAHLLVLLLALVFAPGCEKASQPENKSAEILKRAESYFAQGQFNAATIEVKNALKENNSNLDAFLLLARIYLEQGNYNNAAKVLLELPQDNLQVVILLGQTYQHQGKYKSLFQLLQPLKNRDDARDSVEFQLLLARSLARHEAPQEAQTLLQTLAGRLTRPEQLAELEVVRAQAWQAQGDPTRQMEALDSALRHQPNNIDALVEKARLYIQNRNYEAAEDVLSQALMALPSTDTITLKRLTILQAMVATLTRQGRSVEAMVYSKLIAEANPKAQELQAEFQSAVDQLKAGNLKEAEAILSKLYSSEHAALAGSVLGLIKFQQGEFEQAAQLLQETVDPETASPEALRAFAESQLRLQNPEQALKTIEANVSEHPNDPDILGIYGLSLLATQHDEKGIETIKAALKLDPSRSRLRMALVDTYNRQGKYDEALQQLEAAYSTTPDDIVVQERLVKQYRVMKKDSALALLVDALAKKSAPQSQALAGLALLASDPARAAVLLDKAYQAAPVDLSVLRAQVARYTVAGDHHNSLRFAKELIALNVDDLFALSVATQAEIAQKRDAAAVEYLKSLSEQNANAWGPDFVLARYNLAAGKIDQALQHAESALARSAFNRTTTALTTQLHFLKAQQLAANRQFAEARETLMKGLQIDPSNLELMHLLVAVELEEKNIKSAEKLVGEMEQMASGSHFAYMAAGDLAQAKGEQSAALLAYQNAWKIQATDRLGNILWSGLDKDSDQAREKFLEEWKQRLPASFQVLTIEGLYRQSKGANAAAIEAYRRSLAINPRQPAVLNNLAWLQLEAGDLKNALQNASAAKTLSPDNPSILDTYGWIAFKNGDTGTALSALEQAARLLPENQEIADHLAQVRNAR